MSYKSYGSYKTHKNQNGLVALLMVIVVMMTSATLALSVVFVFLNQIKSTRNTAYSYESIYAAESGVEDILLRYFDADKNLPAFPSILTVGSATASSTISTDDLENDTITSEGDRQGRFRRIVVDTSPSGTGVFSLAVQIGEGGLTMDSNSEVIGNVYSNGDITGASNTEIDGDASAVGIISSPRPAVTGTKTEGAESHPLREIDTDYWKARANINSDPIIGDIEYEGDTNLGPRKIEGNLTLDGNVNLTVTGPIHVTGNFTMESNAALFLDEGLSATSTALIVEGVVTFSSNSEIHSTVATPKGYIMVLSESAVDPAIDISSNNPIEAALYAPNGTISTSSNADLVSIAGYAIHLNSNTEIVYDLGLRELDFSGGPTIGAEIISWQEQ